MKPAGNRAEGFIFTRSDATTTLKTARKTKASTKSDGRRVSAGNIWYDEVSRKSLSLKEGPSSPSDWLRGGHKLPSIINRFHTLHSRWSEWRSGQLRDSDIWKWPIKESGFMSSLVSPNQRITRRFWNTEEPVVCFTLTDSVRKLLPALIIN